MDIIKACFNEQKKLNDEINFTYDEYKGSWSKFNNKPNKKFKMRNRDGSEVNCEIVYFPLPYYKDIRACIVLSGTTDYREVPVRYIN